MGSSTSIFTVITLDPFNKVGVAPLLSFSLHATFISRCFFGNFFLFTFIPAGNLRYRGFGKEGILCNFCIFWNGGTDVSYHAYQTGHNFSHLPSLIFFFDDWTEGYVRIRARPTCTARKILNQRKELHFKCSQQIDNTCGSHSLV